MFEMSLYNQSEVVGKLSSRELRDRLPVRTIRCRCVGQWTPFVELPALRRRAIGPRPRIAPASRREASDRAAPRS